MQHSEKHSHERRRHPRISIQMIASLKTMSPQSDAELFEANLLDLGLIGARLKTAYCFEVGQEIMVNIYLPLEGRKLEIKGVHHYSEKYQLPVVAFAKVVWQRPLVDGNYEMGLHFSDITPADKERLEMFFKRRQDFKSF
jgi:c-di-GMP-binding flagellar brake protein YcgR